MRREVKILPVMLIVVSSLLLLPVFIYPLDWAGWLLVYFSFVLPLFFIRIRRDRKLLTIILLIVAAHNAVSIYNIYGNTVFGADMDAVKFQDFARELATGRHPLWFTGLGDQEVGTNIYSRLLAGFYRVFGVSLLLGQSLSVIAYTLSCVVFIYLVATLGFRSNRSLVMILGASAPAIIYCSVTMREAWQVLFYLLLIYFTLQLRIAPSILKSIYILLCGLVLGLLHNGLFVYTLALVGFSLYWGASGKWKKGGYKKIVIRATILLMALIALNIWFYLGGEIGGVALAIRSGDATTYTENYRERGEQDASANYQVKVDTSSILGFATSGSLAFLYYQFAPFPWQIRRALDIYAGFEALLRLTLMVYMFRLWWRARNERRRMYGYLTICYLSLEFLWALGTANWGTATRHHIIAYSVLVLLGAPGLIYSLERLLLRMKSRATGILPRRGHELKGIKAIG